MKFHVIYNSWKKNERKNSRISFLYTNRISYFFGTIDNSEFRSFSNIFLCVASLRLESSNWKAAILPDRRRGRRLNSGRNLRYDFAVIAVRNRTTELRSAFVSDNYKSHLITFPRLCFAAIFIGFVIAPALIRDRFNHILTVPRSVRDYYVHVRRSTVMLEARYVFCCTRRRIIRRDDLRIAQKMSDDRNDLQNLSLLHYWCMIFTYCHLV